MTPWQKAKRLARGEDAAPLTALTRDPAFHPRSPSEWDEYVAERAAIFEYLGEKPRAEAEACALVLAGPWPGPWEQQRIGGGR